MLIHLYCRLQVGNIYWFLILEFEGHFGSLLPYNAHEKNCLCKVTLTFDENEPKQKALWLVRKQHNLSGFDSQIVQYSGTVIGWFVLSYFLIGS